MERKVWIVGLGVAVLVLVIGGVVWAAEASQPGGSEGQSVDVTGQATRRLQDYVVRGTVTAVEESQVSVETPGGTTAVLFITDATRLWVPGEPPTTTVELAVGDPVLAFGEAMQAETGEKALSARVVVVADEQDLPKVVIQGRAVAVTRQTIVVQTGRGERAITVLPRTRIWSPGGRLDSPLDLQQGEQIIALGQPTELGQWIGGLVLLPNLRSPARNGLRGEVMAIDAQAGALVVQTEQRGEITVVTDAGTRYRIPGTEGPGFADIQVGDKIVALGRFEAGNPTTFLARVIAVSGTQAGETDS